MSLGKISLVQPYIFVLNSLDGGKQIAGAILADIDTFLCDVVGNRDLGMPKPNVVLFLPAPTDDHALMMYNAHLGIFRVSFSEWFAQNRSMLKEMFAAFIDEIDEDETEEDGVRQEGDVVVEDGVAEEQDAVGCPLGLC